ncbi:hypothetical protein KP509_34G032500 [Ceratopteris richardii]|uniref:Peptidase S1 domain-containing protein n=1 Tax=Ceratopteris richardii TaxID=49495 RepID=A0A8T2QJH9_CERRI|nr:hypothetical protein KP509_34G032500 [Ceratopteris richardii]KAH7283956.1 hypothetical protein KP509_34G032500 [Ceratopteris richardii]
MARTGSSQEAQQHGSWRRAAFCIVLAILCTRLLMSGLSRVAGEELEKETRRPIRRALLPSGTVVEGDGEKLRSHVVCVRSRMNGIATGVLLKKSYVLTAKSVVHGVLDPFELTLELGNQSSHGFLIHEHPSTDLAVIKVHPPFQHTGRSPAPSSPAGFFWPLASRDPSPRDSSSLTVFGYGASILLSSNPSSSSSCSDESLTMKSVSVSRVSSGDRFFFRSEWERPTTASDVGGPAFLTQKNGSSIVGVITGRRPHEGELLSVARHREWIFDAMKSECSREQQSFKPMLVGKDPDILIYYHCRVERAEVLGVHLLSKPAPCQPGWKSIRMSTPHGKVLAKLHTTEKKTKDSISLTPRDLKSSPKFYIELWKPRKHSGPHTMVAKHGPFNVSDYMDGGLHFEWCQG